MAVLAIRTRPDVAPWTPGSVFTQAPESGAASAGNPSDHAGGVHPPRSLALD